MSRLETFGGRPPIMRIMRKAKISLEDIARAAGVSVATVDRVINSRGGVRPDKEERILAAARSLGLDRSLSHRPARTLRIGVLLQSPKNPFHAALREGFTAAGRMYTALNLRLHVQPTDPTDPADTARRIDALIGQREALIASLPDDPRVSAALRRFARTGPVVTLVTDIADSGRSQFVGPDDYRGGRIAGDLMGLLMRPEGGNVLMIGGHAENTGQRQRQAGFRAILADRHPGTRLVRVLETGEDSDLVGRMVEKALIQDGSIRGIYQASTGTQQICDALRRLGRAGETVIVAHELTPNRKQLLIERRIHAIIDQNPALEARLAFEAVARLLGRLEGATEPQAVETRIFMAESF